jgi:hypothetical protein
MDWKMFVASLVRWGAWPVVVLILVYNFRREVRDLLDSIEEIAAPGGWKFSRKLEKAAEAAERIEPPTAIRGRIEAHEGADAAGFGGTVDAELERQAAEHPDLMIRKSFDEIVKAGLAYRERVPKIKHTYDLISTLEANGELPKGSLELYEKLKVTRAAAMREPRRIAPAQALEFRSLCLGLASLIRDATKA